MPFKSVERPATPDAAPDVSRPPGTRDALVAQNREQGIEIVDELSRITATMAAGLPVTSAEVLAIADRIATLRRSVEFSDVVQRF